VGEFHQVTEISPFLEEGGANHARQMIVGPEPPLSLNDVVGDRHDVRQYFTHNPRLPDDESELQSQLQVPRGIGDKNVAEGEVGNRLSVERLEHGIPRPPGRCIAARGGAGRYCPALARSAPTSCCKAVIWLCMFTNCSSMVWA
jgi:hypothetical protein